jgi:Tfp pilus assembly protein PilO
MGEAKGIASEGLSYDEAMVLSLERRLGLAPGWMSLMEAENGRLRAEVESLKSGVDRKKLQAQNETLRRRIDQIEEDLEKMRECFRTLILMSGIQADDLA